MFKGIAIVIFGFFVAALGLVVSIVSALLDLLGVVEMSIEQHLVILGTGVAVCVILMIVGGTIHVVKMMKMF